MNWRISLVQSLTAHMPLLTAASTFRLGRRRCRSPQQCYRHCLLAFFWKKFRKKTKENQLTEVHLVSGHYSGYAVLLMCRQTQWDAPTWDVMADEEEDDMDLGTPTNDESRVSFMSALVEYFAIYSPACVHFCIFRVIEFAIFLAFD